MLYTASDEILDLLSDEQAGRLMKALFKYELGQPLPEMDGMTLVAFTSIKGYLDKDGEKYDETCRKRREAGSKGGRPKKENQTDTDEETEKAKKPNGFSGNQTKGRKPDYESDSESDSEYESESEYESDSESEREKGRTRKREPKSRYGEYGHVMLTDPERERLFNDYGEAETLEAIKFLDEYIEEKGYKSKSHNLTMRKWVFKAVQERKGKGGKPSGGYDWDSL